MAFKDLKKATDLSSLLETITKKDSNTTFEKDTRFYTCEVDKTTGNGSALIRFLPTPDGDETPIVKLYTHGFTGPDGKWYIENCPTTIGETCPVCEDNSIHWKSKTEKGIQLARARKRKLSYIANILVLRDKAHPENEGKVFLMKFGKQIHDKIVAAMNPQDDDELETPIPAFNPFDMWTGANFLLKIITKKTGNDKNLNFEQSKFMAQSELYDGDDEKLEVVYNSEYKLAPFIDSDNFKPYADLKARFEKVSAGKTGAVVNIEPVSSQNTGKSLASASIESSDIDDEIDNIFNQIDGI